MESDKIYTIREVSKMFDLPVSTLRYYEDEGKLKELHADYDHMQKKIRFYKDIKKAMENGLPKPDWEDYK